MRLLIATNGIAMALELPENIIIVREMSKNTLNFIRIFYVANNNYLFYMSMVHIACLLSEF